MFQRVAGVHLGSWSHQDSMHYWYEGGSQQEDPWFEFCWGRAFLCRFCMSSPCLCGVRVLWFTSTIKTCTQGWFLSQCPWARHWLRSGVGPFLRMFTTAPLRWVKCRVPASLCSLCTILHCIICDQIKITKPLCSHGMAQLVSTSLLCLITFL